MVTNEAKAAAIEAMPDGLLWNLLGLEGNEKIHDSVRANYVGALREGRLGDGDASDVLLELAVAEVPPMTFNLVEEFAAIGTAWHFEPEGDLSGSSMEDILRTVLGEVYRDAFQLLHQWAEDWAEKQGDDDA